MPRKPLAKTSARGYDYKHKQRRRRYLPLVRSGQAACWRCGQPIDPNGRWDLGHSDTDRSITMGPEHVGKECPAGGNRATRSRRTTPSTPSTDTSRPW